MAVACALAFKQGKHDEAVKLMYELEHPEDVATVFRVKCKLPMRTATVSLVHLAAYHGWLDVVKYQRLTLLFDGRDSVGQTPLHYAAVGGRLPVVQYLITEQHCDPATPGLNNNTPLHYACVGGHTNIVQYLITELGCDPIVSNIDGSLPLHIACRHGHLDLAKYLITEQNCDPMCENKENWRPLHHACAGGHKNIVRYLITKLGHDLIVDNINGTLPLHIACINGHLDLTKYFVTDLNCDLVCKDKGGRTPLQCAIEYGHMNIVQYFIEELDCDHPLLDVLTRPLSTRLSIGLDMFSRFFIKANKSEMQIQKFVQTLVRVKRNSPIHLFNKVILSGNSAAGKSTLAKVIEERAKTYFNMLKYYNIQAVNAKTAGIVSNHVESWEVGNITLYDLAGQAEYHTSHSAVMETVMQRSPAIFVYVLDLSKQDSEILHQFCYWLTFIDNATYRIPAKSCLIIVGSHADLLSKEILKEKVSLVTNLVHERVKKQEFMGFVSMDCRRINSSGTREFISILYKSQKVIAASAPSVSCYCHLLYEFRQSKQIHCKNKFGACSLQELAASLAKDESYLPSELSKLAELLLLLSDKGMITFIKNQQNLEKSWIVADTEGLLKHVLGILFAPKGFQEHIVASSTGIMHTSYLQDCFPMYNLEMLLNVLESLELCHRVSLSGLSTNLTRRTTHLPTEDVELGLFFPSLLDVCRPDVLLSGKFTFGWCLTCQDQQYQFFTSRFLHVLLLRLASTFPLAHARSSDFKKSCNIWMNGISWDTAEGIRTVVEVIGNQCVLIAMAFSDKSRGLEYSKHRSAVIKLVLDLKQQLCSHIDTNEYLINQPFLSKWPAGEMSPSVDDLLPMKNVCLSMLLHKPYIVTCANIRSGLTTEDILIFEPYQQLLDVLIYNLMVSRKADEPVPPGLLSEMICSSQLQAKRWTYSSLREYLDEMSLFAGKNLLDLVGPADVDTFLKNFKESAQVILTNHQDDDSTLLSNEFVATSSVHLNSLPEEPFDLSHLPQLLTALQEVVDWFNLGLQLGVHYSILRTVQVEQQTVEDRKREMLVKWLQNGNSCNKNTLKTALRKIRFNVIDHPINLQLNSDAESFRTISHEIKFDANGLKYHMTDHGITVIIPENAVTTETLLSIGVYMYYVNSFQLPKNHRLVSEVFWIKTSVPLQKNAELYVPHFVNIRDDKDSSKLGFFIASDVSTKDVQTLTKVPANSCSFEPGSCYGKLVMDHFCSGCILETIYGNGLPLRYLVTRVFPNDFVEKKNWWADIVFSYALKSCLKVVEKQYSKDEYLLAKRSVIFTQPSATLDYELDLVPGWSITQITGGEILREQIDYRTLITQTSGSTAAEPCALQELEKINRYPPRLTLKIARSKHAQEHLKTNIAVKGFDPQAEFQVFAQCPGKAESLPLDEALSEAHFQQLLHHSSSKNSSRPIVEESSERHSSLAEGEREKFLSDVILALQDHLIKKWFTFGIYLNLTVTELNVLETNSLVHADKRASVRHMLTKWKDKFGKEATWDKIVDALRKSGQNALAKDLEDKHMQSEEQEVKETAPNPPVQVRVRVQKSTSMRIMISKHCLCLAIVVSIIAIFITAVMYSM